MADSLLVAIDGPSGSGKSSASRLLATRLGIAYLDTGAMYRAVATEYRRRGLSPDDAGGIRQMTLAADLRIATDPEQPLVTINGRDVTTEIREPAVSACVSQVATNLDVRGHLTRKMREIIAAHHRRIVVEGRDITTVVAPDADVRVLLVADPEARVARRQAELGEAVDREAVTDQVVRRDRDDSTVANFLEAGDGVQVIDSTHLSLSEVVDAICSLVPPVASGA